MNHLAHVLVGVDFSGPSRAAYEYAVVLSRACGAELTAVHAVPRDRTFRFQARERISMIEALHQAAEAAGVRLKVSVQQGDPADVILVHAHARRPDLIVLGTQQRSGVERFRLGSVAETVTLQATQPVLIVPRSFGGRTAESEISYKSILVAVDFSPSSIAAVDRALSMAHANMLVTLVHVVPSVPFAHMSPYTYHLSESDHQSLLARDARQRLQDTTSSNAGTSRNVHTRVATGEPSTEIARIAKDVDADLILLGVTSRGPLGRRLWGATAARLIRIAERPVLAIPERAGQVADPQPEVRQHAIAA
ncbi:MAG: universal stress protein [Vicinamibacterales bacterium]